MVEWYDVPSLGEPAITIIPKEADEGVIRLAVSFHFIICCFLGVHNLYSRRPLCKVRSDFGLTELLYNRSNCSTLQQGQPAIPGLATMGGLALAPIPSLRPWSRTCYIAVTRSGYLDAPTMSWLRRGWQGQASFADFKISACTTLITSRLQSQAGQRQEDSRCATNNTKTRRTTQMHAQIASAVSLGLKVVLQVATVPLHQAA